MIRLKLIEEIKINSKERHIIYALMNKNNIVYIGQSSCGIRRCLVHQFGNNEETEKEFTSIKIYLAPENKTERCKVENELINFYKPKYNRRKNYGKS